MILTPNDVGVLVEHTVWRRGKVIEILSPYAIIHFPALANSPQGPQRKLREDAPQLTKASVQTDPELDGIETGPGKPKKISKRKVKDLQNDLDAAVQWFEGHFPAKFEDEKFIDNDLRNKRSAADVFLANFGEGRGAAMVDQGKHAEISSTLDGIYRATNILSPFEVKAVHKAMAEAVSQLPADGGKVHTWPIVTLLPFLADPKRFLPLKPTNTEVIASRMEVNLKYDTTPNWE